MTDIHAFSLSHSLILNPCDTCDFLNLGDFPAGGSLYAFYVLFFFNSVYWYVGIEPQVFYGTQRCIGLSFAPAR